LSRASEKFHLPSLLSLVGFLFFFLQNTPHPHQEYYYRVTYTRTRSMASLTTSALARFVAQSVERLSTAVAASQSQQKFLVYFAAMPSSTTTTTPSPLPELFSEKVGRCRKTTVRCLHWLMKPQRFCELDHSG